MAFVIIGSPSLINRCANTSELTALELAKFILSKKLDQHSIKKMAKELDNNKRLVSEIISFFIEIGWISSNTSGTYAITTKYKNRGRMNRNRLL